ncbi:hypothetical protein PV387_24965 [Streptomyces sp. ME02-6987-2C]|uniref:hypothetical protein n=1 Tax=unclassified Streptomyces TaxID=2593676 RepID=UPI0029BB3785|nr:MULTISPECIES: hypothetical protein [unclassified Streptomyces]MDX3369238.1 hypothetical protein [Streptomyces sp. ME02-6987-2C]MDX3427110.1 hypothetical protein [Streptomyces sp. ME02-6985-2c]
MVVLAQVRAEGRVSLAENLNQFRLGGGLCPQQQKRLAGSADSSEFAEAAIDQSQQAVQPGRQILQIRHEPRLRRPRPPLDQLLLDPEVVGEIPRL